MTEREALKLALEALERGVKDGYWNKDTVDASTRIKEVLAQPEQEPVGTVKELFTQAAWEKHDLRGSTKVYTTPPHRKPLTDEVVSLLYKDMVNDDRTKSFTAEHWFKAGVATGEAAHGIKE